MITTIDLDELIANRTPRTTAEVDALLAKTASLNNRRKTAARRAPEYPRLARPFAAAAPATPKPRLPDGLVYVEVNHGGGGTSTYPIPATATAGRKGLEARAELQAAIDDGKAEHLYDNVYRVTT